MYVSFTLKIMHSSGRGRDLYSDGRRHARRDARGTADDALRGGQGLPAPGARHVLHRGRPAPRRADVDGACDHDDLLADSGRGRDGAVSRRRREEEQARHLPRGAGVRDALRNRHHLHRRDVWRADDAVLVCQLSGRYRAVHRVPEKAGP